LEEARLDALLHLSRIGEASLSEISSYILEQAIALTHSKIGFVGFLKARTLFSCLGKSVFRSGPRCGTYTRFWWGTGLMRVFGWLLIISG
jgi:hypothetical protein